MLGSLARWLRVLGFDVHFDSELDDAALVELAIAERRLILTRDSRLVLRRRARHHLLIRSEAVEEQIHQVLDDLGLRCVQGRLLGRCLRCNETLLELPADEARDQVPAYVARTQADYRRCPTCRRIYWRATHVERMYRRLEAMGLGAPEGNS